MKRIAASLWRGRGLRGPRLRGPRLEALFTGVFVLFAFRLGSVPIRDNSMLTHLRTGIEMVAGAGIPQVDPYSFTAAGTDWVVQSWLASFSYGWLHEIGGFRAVVAQQAVMLGLLAWMMLRLARAGSPLRSALTGGLVIGMAVGYWAPRPFLFGLLAMAATVNVVERRRSPWLLVPVVWIWVNTHGSFPLGLAWLAARAVGEWRDWRAKPSEALRYSWAFLAGLVVAVLNPLGIRILVFPFTTLDRADIFRTIVEWQSPDFQSPEGRIALVCIAAAVVVMARFRLTWRDAVPAATFLALALVSSRNIAVAAIVLAPVLGRALRAPESARLQPAPSASVRRVNRAVVVSLAGLFVAMGVAVATTPGLDLDLYPEDAVDFLQARGDIGPGLRLAHPDGVGNYLELRFGTDAPVFIDDRYDMYPPSVARDYLALAGGSPRSLGILDHYGVESVLWPADLALATILDLAPGWERVYRDGEWVVYDRAAPDGVVPELP